MGQRSNPRGILTFLVLLIGQFVSLLGSRLTAFVLGIWILEKTGSTTRFALISVCVMLPGFLISPMAGTFVDRWNRRQVMIVSDCGAAVCTLFLLLFAMSEQLQLWHIYLASSVISIFEAFQRPAHAATLPLLIPKKHLGRANGLNQLSDALSQIFPPMLGGILFATLHLWNVFLIDFSTFLFALLTLLLIYLPQPKATPEGIRGRGTLLKETIYGWNYLVERPGLLALLLFLAANNFVFGVVITLLTPLILGFTTSVELGIIMSIAGMGMLGGSLVMSVWGGPGRRIPFILGLSVVQGVLLFLGGVQPSILLVASAAFIFMFVDPFILGNIGVVLQKKVAPDVQGRVFALKELIAFSSFPLAALISGPLSEYVFEPLLMNDGLLADNVGRIVGVGPGRGIGFLFILMGALALFITASASLYPQLRRVETEIPDGWTDAG